MGKEAKNPYSEHGREQSPYGRSPKIFNFHIVEILLNVPVQG
jgi:hypothetical protein